MSKNEKTFKVEGMKCGGCVTNVTNAVKELTSVEECSVNLEEGTAMVAGNISTDDVINAITKAGFKATLIK